MKPAYFLYCTFIIIGMLVGNMHCANIVSSQKRFLIQAINIDKNKLVIEINEKFKKKFLLDHFFITYDSDVDLSSMDYSIITIPFILNIISIIWISGDEYFVESMDEDLYYSLILIKKVMSRLYPATSWMGTLTPLRLVKNTPKVPLKDPQKELALFFSGGLDSTSAALSYFDKKLLLITARGQWDVPLDRDDLWEQREKEYRDFAKRYGHTNAFVRSNFAEFLNWDVLESLSDEIATWRLDTVEGIGMFGLAAPILFSKGYSLARIAASYTWAYPWPSSANPLIDNNMCLASLFKLEHDQFNYSRADKIELISNLARKGLVDVPKLKACDSKSPHNCLHLNCSKCIPTAFMLLALGEDPASYGFNLSHDEIIENMVQYLSKKQFYWTLWELQGLREKLKGKDIGNEKIAWFMSVDLKGLVKKNYLRNKKKVYWWDYRDVAPATLKIPEIEIKELK